MRDRRERLADDLRAAVAMGAVSQCQAELVVAASRGRRVSPEWTRGALAVVRELGGVPVGEDGCAVPVPRMGVQEVLPGL